MFDAVIDDNMFIISIGGAGIPIFLGRFIFTYIICMIIFAVTRNIKQETFSKFFFRQKARTKEEISPNQ